VRYLIVSDIHANLEALQAVLEAAAGGYDKVVCCGDLVGYCADPNAVVDWARASLAAVVRGNHDRAAVGLEDPGWFNPVARAATLWTKAQLTPENAAYVRALPKGPCACGGFQLVHGSPVDEDEYVMSSAEAAQALDYVGAAVTFFGHTHVQGGFAWRRGRVEPVPRPGSKNDRRLVEFDPDAAYLLNPGSVGQPRDGDPRAAFALYGSEDGFLWLHRLEYDVKKAQEKIRRAGLPDLLADRLAAGR
jgi:predicted phosphodiesterase